MNSQRFMALDVSVRSLADFVVLKDQDALGLPRTHSSSINMLRTMLFTRRKCIIIRVIVKAFKRERLVCQMNFILKEA